MSMAHVVDGDPANFEDHFLHSDDPRDGFSVMNTNPLICYESRTPIGFHNNTYDSACWIPHSPPPSLTLFILPAPLP